MSDLRRDLVLELGVTVSIAGNLAFMAFSVWGRLGVQEFRIGGRPSYGPGLRKHALAGLLLAVKCAISFGVAY